MAEPAAASPFSPLAYLTFRSLVNRVRMRAQRLRQPRYALGALGGLAYFYFSLLRQSARLTTWAQGEGVLVGSASMFLFTALVWALPAPKHALAFTRAEVQFLFPAPLTRRHLLHYKLMAAQIAGLFTTAILTVLYRPTSPGEALRYFVGMSLVLTTWTLHVLAVSMARQSLSEHGHSGFIRQRLTLVIVLAAVAIVGQSVWSAWPELRAMATSADVMAELHRVTATGPASVVFWPFRALMRVPLSPSAAAFARALPWALGVLALNYVWVLRSDAVFDEASAEQAEKIAAMQKGSLALPRAGKARTVPFRLAASGRHEFAILWKNLILMGRIASAKALLVALPSVFALAVVAAIMASDATTEVVVIFCGFALFNVVLLGPQVSRSDLRRDLAYLAVLKMWPVRGAAIVAGEILAPACVLSAAAWLIILIGAGLLAVSARDRIAYGAAGLLLAPALVTLGLLLQNAFALTFPAWNNPNANRAAGIDAMGQRMILMFGGIFVMTLAIVPAALVAGGAGFAINLASGGAPVVVPALLGALVILGECWFGVLALGRLFDRTDASAVAPGE